VTVVLGLEAIGDDVVAQAREMLKAAGGDDLPPILRRHIDIGRSLRNTWVAEILGPGDHYKWERDFLKGKKDYTNANSIGSRGVMVYYHLKDGPVYEVHSWVSWSSVDRYFCRIESGEIVRMTEEEVEERVGS